jgi:hypothetical protein
MLKFDGVSLNCLNTTLFLSVATISLHDSTIRTSIRSLNCNVAFTASLMPLKATTEGCLYYVLA